MNWLGYITNTNYNFQNSSFFLVKLANQSPSKSQKVKKNIFPSFLSNTSFIIENGSQIPILRSRFIKKLKLSRYRYFSAVIVLCLIANLLKTEEIFNRRIYHEDGP